MDNSIYSETTPNSLSSLKNLSFKGSYDWFQEGSIAAQIFLGIFIVCVIYLIIYIVSTITSRVLHASLSTPFIIRGLRTASTPLTLVQNAKSSKLIMRSKNEKNGIEFTYATWMKIDAWETQTDAWKHVFHKGVNFELPSHAAAEPHDFCEIQAPGLWIHPKQNTLRFYMNTFNSAHKFVDIPNIPIQKWFHVAIIVSHRSFDVYINGFLKEHVDLKDVPRQNYNDLHVTRNGGFQGHLSQFQYFNYALRPVELNILTQKGPSLKTYTETSQNMKNYIPYLSTQWWL